MDKKLKIEFAPGCFDSFEGTQEELDEMISEITKMIDSGEFFEKATLIDIDDELELEDTIEHSLNTSTRVLQ
jgi:uncharacterized protein YqgV (UPF0045/DUF77 family)